ncbi:Miniconductance mechanosensitive channel MscM precursor [Novipirellula galeiformis]|uniref:Miniconductance mechanosensitive channel MscM n=1 Tax=Novipirellula galeiformis TaxID=2528004 RepID=A0A5C6CAF6_9BACT|nr:mechanosensitive ion channel domain-containing protein [Novipirellula galeiformis]TWU21560.1 Miniconductance mechanosensitive channel MscM precursor [Novipirellula galeiformis]
MSIKANGGFPPGEPVPNRLRTCLAAIPHPTALPWCVLVIVLAGLPTGALGQQNGQQGGDIPKPVTIENPIGDRDAVDATTIEAGLAALAAAESLDPSLKTSLEDLYQQAKQNLSAAELSAKNAQQLEAMAAEAPARMKQAKMDLDSKEVVKWTLDPDATVESIKQTLAESQLELNELVSTESKLTTAPGRSQKRLTEIPQEISQLEKDLEQVEKQLANPALANEPAVQTQARTTQLRSKRQALRMKMEELRKEQAAYLATTELVALQKQLADRDIATLRNEVQQLQETLTQRQRSEVADKIENLRDDLQRVPEKLKPLAQRNIEVTEQHQALVNESARANAELNETRAAFEDVKNTLKISQERLEAIGLTDALGLMLRNKRNEFEELRNKFRPRADLQEKIQQHQISVFSLEDSAEEVDERIAAIRDSAHLAEELELLRRRKELLVATMQAQNSILQTMLTVDTQRHELRNVIDEYIDFVDQNVFWIRSSPAFSLQELKYVPETLRWLAEPTSWRKVLDQMMRNFVWRPLRSLLGLLGVLALFVYRIKLRRLVYECGEQALRPNAKFRITATTLFFTILVACAWPALFRWIGWMLLSNLGNDAFVNGVGNAFSITALFIASRELIKEVCRDHGLAQLHFGWDKAVRSMLRFHLRWYTVLGGILIFVMVMIQDHSDTQLRATASRLTSIALFLVTASFHSIVFSIKSPIFLQARRHSADSKAYLWRRVIWFGLTGFPIVFAGLAFAGYLDTAFNLGTLMQYSILLLVLVLLLMALTFRWLSLHYREVARRQAREQREKKLASLQSSATDGLTTDVGIELQEEDQADLPKLDRQTRQLIYVVATVFSLFGFALIWSNVLPAIEIFDRVELWSVHIGKDMEVEVVTFRDMLYAIAAIVVLAYSVRNLPGLVELFVLRQTSLDSGARYALTTMLRYALTVTGALVVLNIISVPWTQLGWLLAAASVGLGFGLQEIVANFVSGIILLLERPVRVGDVVTIDNTTGVVSRIQMRATTITSWERKELVVPNKDLITGKILNWSLSNVINRLTMEVGVEYDADPDQVRDILEHVVTKHPDVMEDPAPLINFDTFGDSSLNFSIRFYLANLDRRVGVTHEINTAILTALRAADISIPFPQRDLNLSVKTDTHPLSVHLQPQRDGVSLGHSDGKPRR